MSDSTRFDHLIKLLCHEHLECLRVLRQELSGQRRLSDRGKRPLVMATELSDTSCLALSPFNITVNGETLDRSPVCITPTRTGSISPTRTGSITSTSCDRYSFRHRPENMGVRGSFCLGQAPGSTAGTSSSIYREDDSDNEIPSERVPVCFEPVNSEQRKSPRSMPTRTSELSVANFSLQASEIVTEATGQFQLRRTWQEQIACLRISELNAVFHMSGSGTALSDLETDSAGNFDSVMTTLVLHPSSRQRFTWDLLCLFLIVYDVIVMPLQAFDLSEHTILLAAAWFARVMWTLDMPMSCFTGFYREGRLHMAFYLTTRHYLTTWFGFDLCLVLMDWLLQFLGNDADNTGNSGGFVRILRIARIARMLRLLRLLKLQRVVQGIEDLIDTESLSVYFKCLKPCIGMVLFLHVLCCGWYGLGKLLDQNHHRSWLQLKQIRERSIYYRYTSSLHWALAQFTLSSMDIHARNSGERLYTIAVLMFGIFGFSCLVSLFTSAAEQLREMKSDETRQFWLLRRFMKDYFISSRLSNRVIRYCEYAYSHQKARKQEHEVALLQLLSDQLRKDISMEIHLPELIPHPLFERMAFLKFTCLGNVCAKALAVHAYARGDSILSTGAIARGMILFTDGVGRYYVHGDTQRGGKRLMREDWLCEGSLWAQWTNLGSAKAIMNSRVVVVDANVFAQIFCDAPSTEWLMVHKYAIRFIEALNLMDEDHLSDMISADVAFDPEVPISPQSAGVRDQPEVSTIARMFCKSPFVRRNSPSGRRSPSSSSPLRSTSDPGPIKPDEKVSKEGGASVEPKASTKVVDFSDRDAKAANAKSTGIASIAANYGLQLPILGKSAVNL